MFVCPVMYICLAVGYGILFQGGGSTSVSILPEGWLVLFAGNNFVSTPVY